MIAFFVVPPVLAAVSIAVVYLKRNDHMKEQRPGPRHLAA